MLIPTGLINQDIQLIVSYQAVQQPVKAQRVPGIDEGRFIIPDDFDDPLPPDLLEAFK